MTGRQVLRYWPRFVGMLIVIHSLAMPTWARDKDTLFVPPDCGLNSLFLLLELSGHPTDLSLLRDKLPPQSPGGYSLFENSGTQRRCRISLPRNRSREGKSGAGSSCGLAFLGGRSNGHFVVIRPVGGGDRSEFRCSIHLMLLWL